MSDRELTIALEEGFDHRHVVVLVDGRVVLDDPDVSTRHQIGLARSVRVALPEGDHFVGVRLDGSDRLDLRIDTAAIRSVRVSVTADGGVHAVAGGDLPGYL
ncbi:hypothetical protein AB0K80_22645 [Streptomyces sp. NPDC052682]|uniref:hypothetical protein n=1 Tax=Streptomyces sp. NPDC052682 TaxID=3154954 RepID=UPI00343D58B4